MVKKSFIIHPFLLPLFPILTFFNHNFSELMLENLTQPLIITLVSALIVWSLLNLYIKDKHKSAVITSITLFLLLSAGRYLNTNQALSFSDSILPQFLMQNKFLSLIIVFLLLVFSAYFIRKVKRNFKLITIALNIISISLLVIPVITISYKQSVRLTHELGIIRVVKFTLNIKNINELPDIYYLVIDRYASDKTLKDYYKFNNAEFTNMLRNKGFYVASQSAANYPGTHSSLPSSLNMRYHDELIKKMGTGSFDKTPYFKLIENNEVVALLKYAGYKYFHFGSMWDPTKVNKFADYNYNYIPKPRNLIEAGLEDLKKNKNSLAIFLSESLGKTVTDELSQEKNYWRISIDQMFELSKRVTVPGPKFIFMHSLITHPPYVFSHDGRPLPKPLEGAGYQKEYIEQLKFANQMIEKLIDSILQSSKKPPVIILQADEGPYPDQLWTEGGRFDWRTATSDQIKEKMRILNAYYFPNVKSGMLYPAISPVNSFRVVFNLFFEENLPLLPDRSYIFASSGRPYNLIDVTKILK